MIKKLQRIHATMQIWFIDPDKGIWFNTLNFLICVIDFSKHILSEAMLWRCVTKFFKNYAIFPDIFFVWNRAYVELTDKNYCSRGFYSKKFFVCEMVLVTWVETALRGRWWRLLAICFDDFLSFFFDRMSNKITFPQWGSAFKNYKFAKASSGCNSVSELNIISSRWIHFHGFCFCSNGFHVIF